MFSGESGWETKGAIQEAGSQGCCGDRDRGTKGTIVKGPSGEKTCVYIIAQGEEKPRGTADSRSQGQLLITTEHLLSAGHGDQH